MQWPGFEILEGPALVGLQPGDLVAVDAARPILLYDRRSPQPFGFDIDIDEHIDHALLRLHEEDEEYRRRRDRPRALLVGDEGFFVAGHAAAVGSVHVAGPWRLKLVDDVGAVPTVRTIGGLLLGRPLGLRMADHALLSVWLLVTDPSKYAFVRSDGSVTVLPRRVGVPLDQLRRSKRLGGALDPERAKAIAGAAAGALPSVFLGYDGDVFHSGVDPRGWSALEHFCRLIGEPLAWERDRPGAQAAFDRTVAADETALADLARAADPQGFAREQQVREECALLG